MRKLIEVSQEYLVVCDNESCDFKVENLTKDPRKGIKLYLNVPCPKCGENLLTSEDYANMLVSIRMIDFINKWFSWITIFTPNINE